MKLHALLFEPRSFITCPVESYTLFGTLCWRYYLLFGEKKLNEFLKAYEEKPPLIISSPILYHRGDYYFPLPILPSEYLTEDERRKREQERLNKRAPGEKKKMKGLRFITWKLLRRVLTGEIGTMTGLFESLTAYQSLLQNPEPKRCILVRNSINRLTNTTAGGELYNLPCLLYPPFIVLFLLYENCPFSPELLLTIFDNSSIGGKKSSGLGRVKVSPWEDKNFLEEITPFITSPTRKFYTLSPVFYDKAFDLSHSFYHLYTFTGIIDNYYFSPLPTIIKKRVIYFGSGSTFRLSDQKNLTSNKNVFGKLKIVNKDIKRNINIYQYGYAFPLYIQDI